MIVIIGGGPAGLIAAEMLSAAQCGEVHVYDRKPRVGRKFLLAGRGGLNLTHSEDITTFIARYGQAADWIAPMIHAFPPDALRKWADGLGQPTFVGSSGRIFPRDFKASPLLRAWLGRLDAAGVRFHTGYNWTGWDAQGRLTMAGPDGVVQTLRPDATLLALGGASWPKTGSDGGWTSLLAACGIDIVPLNPANCGFHTVWSPVFREKFAGQPLKSITLTHNGRNAPGDIMIDSRGVEGGAIYTLSARLRDAIAQDGHADLTIDLKPGLSVADLAGRLAAPRKGRSLPNILRRAAGLSPVAAGLVYEAGGRDLAPPALAALIKAIPLRLDAPFPIDRAISTAGGISRNALDTTMMLRALPGVFAAGEMIDWEAPTGGYLLQGCFATGVAAARGIQSFLNGS